MRKEILLYVILLLLTPAASLIAQSQEKLYALMILNFAKGINWPSTSNHEFIIAVIGYSPLANEISSTAANVRINGRPIRVIEMATFEGGVPCQMIFVPSYKAKKLAAIHEHLRGQPVVIVTNAGDTNKSGSDIDLILREGKLTFDINCKSIESRGMKVSTSLRSTARIID